MVLNYYMHDFSSTSNTHLLLPLYDCLISINPFLGFVSLFQCLSLGFDAL